MTHQAIVTDFYTAFAEGDANRMVSYYHDEAIFQDPAFGSLSGDRVPSMWRMLLSNKDAAPQISFSNISVRDDSISAEWRAEYLFGPKKRRVVNEVLAQMQFQDGKIISHVDSFDVWKWAKQALGLTGVILGWSPFMKNKIRHLSNQKLDQFIDSNK